MADTVIIPKADYVALLDAIRDKGGTSALMTTPEATAAVEAIETGEGDGTFDFANPAWPNGSITTEMTSIFRGCFSQRSGITRIEAPNALSASDEAFRNCRGLTSVYVPMLYTAASYCFESCVSLSGVALPSLKSFSGQFLTNCTNLEYVDFGPTLGFIGQGDTFKKTSLKTLVLRYTARVVTIPNTNLFTNSPFASGGTGGTLYVPAALISSYQSATNWSTILSYENNQILPIEGSIYETQYADGTPIE